MNFIKTLTTILIFSISFTNYSQQRQVGPKVIVTGKIIDKSTKQPLEYATVSLINTATNKVTSGGITDDKGNFSFDANPGIYDIKYEFSFFKPLEVKGKSIKADTDLGTVALQDDATQLNEVVVVAKKQEVEIKLDKKVYNVGQDGTAKGGTASDVLDNVPSVTVDSNGNVSLRGNDNVKILIDGRPSNSVNIADALKTISADALDKIEVITNPSARYDAEGGGGIINILLKKGKNQGLNGSVSATVGNPKNYGVIGNINYKTENFNLFSTIGYNDSDAPGKSLTDSDYLNPDGSIYKTINERVNRHSARKGYNYNFGVDWYLDKTLTWSNSLSYRKNDGSSPMNDVLNNYENNNNFVQNRFNDQYTYTNDVEYNTNLTKNFKKPGHKLTLNATVSRDKDNDTSIITTSYIGNISNVFSDYVKNFQSQGRNLFQGDYVLPIGENGQFEAGYKADFNNLDVKYNVESVDVNGIHTQDPRFNNTFKYNEKVNAVYSQFGSKVGKFSYLFGLRYENSNINFTSFDAITYKKYGNFFPSAFLTYQVNDNTSVSLNYSKRVARPRSRFIIPFSNYTSNINFFEGNPDINPSFTDAIELGFMKKINKLTINSSLYYNKTKNPFQFIKRPNGEDATSIVNGQPVVTPIYISTPVNLAFDNRVGVEFNINYSPYKWWRLNGNFNFFKSDVTGTYQYSLIGSTDVITQNGAKNSSSWFTKFSSKITLPYKVDWQLNGTYNAPQSNSQGKSLGVYAANTSFSKDILKDKATITLNVNDIFNSRKRINQTNLPTLNSYSEMQFRQRQINLTFTYRFNKQKSDKEKQPKKEGGDDGDFPG